MRMFFDDDVTELDAQLASLLSRGRGGSHDSVEDQARRDFEEILGRRGGKGGSQEMVGDASNLVKIADDLTKPTSAAVPTTMSPDAQDRMATALENIQHMIGSVTARPSAGARAFAWASANPWRVATIVLGLAGAIGLYTHYVPKKKK